MSYQLLIEEKAVKELDSITKEDRERIKTKIKDILRDNPFPEGKGDIKKIKGSDYWRLRVGDYRVFYDIDQNDDNIFILSVRHRSTAYREL